MSRPIAQPEHHELQRLSRAPSETVSRHQRAIASLAVAEQLVGEKRREVEPGSPYHSCAGTLA